MIDTTLLGQTAAKCMEYMDENEQMDGSTLISVGLIVIAESSDGETTFTRTFCSDERHYHQVGLMHMGMTCVLDGVKNAGPPSDDEPDELR